MDVPNRARKFGLVFSIIIINGTVSKRGGFWRLYLDLIQLRSYMDAASSGQPRSLELAVNIIIKYGAVSKRGGLWRRCRLYLDLVELRSIMDVPNRTRK